MNTHVKEFDAMFHDFDGNRELIAVGEYEPADPGDRWTPPLDATVNLLDVMTSEGGSLMPCSD